ncbi:5'/3'-nucleotidase SurE [Neisseria leonii]|uniref:5'-nucleotidase SurE n=1 Tax=Neisseria leonii TaxID=2995413 RepID=A0A9X4IAP1_9NEIS|nr:MULTISPECIES: 5'/3'-nucleotidase SurE [unclassified Neisseria]MDD9324848.1 5'/3'-nucleotidase SurE [Neisseria sp. 3986]MDD9327595.1 5'/3'-nucleotidase SurE [Neisseria sp. 51.81]
MNILVCNDDGYLAQGIAVLARVAGEFANVRVVAPERNRSGVSNSLTLDRPLQLRQAENGFYFVSGTPTDCIHLALHAMPEFVPDLVISGINHGANMGDDTLYSGTVAAATEAYLLGFPAVAFSLNDIGGRYWDTAEKAAWRLLDYLVKNPPQKPILWNINIPAVAPEDIQGFKVTRLGRRHHQQSIVPMRNPRGEEVYWLGPVGEISDRESGTDFAECEAGFITVTPLQIDLTAYPQLAETRDFWRNLA